MGVHLATEWFYGLDLNGGSEVTDDMSKFLCDIFLGYRGPLKMLKRVSSTPKETCSARTQEIIQKKGSIKHFQLPMFKFYVRFISGTNLTMPLGDPE